MNEVANFEEKFLDTIANMDKQITARLEEREAFYLDCFNRYIRKKEAEFRSVFDELGKKAQLRDPTSHYTDRLRTMIKGMELEA